MALPNIEDPDALIREWKDQPRPRSLPALPVGSYLLAENATEEDPETGMILPLPRFFNAAHPKHRLSSLQGGEEMVLTGMSPEGILRFQIPRIRMEAFVSLESRTYTLPLQVDTLCLFVEERSLTLTFRAPFLYRFVPEERRSVRLQWGQLQEDGVLP